MARIFVTGSSQGLGLMAGQLLAAEGHAVVLHARDAARAEDARIALPSALEVVTGDMFTLAGMHGVAKQANALGRFDAVIHNVGIGYREPVRVETKDGLSHLWAVNVLAPYVLTVLMERPNRLIYLSSGMHEGANPGLDDPQWARRPWRGAQAYSDSKLHDLWLAFAVARLWPGVTSNAVSPGWVPTRMGGPDAPGDMNLSYRTQAWLAASDDPDALVTGRYLQFGRPAPLHPLARDVNLHDKLLGVCREASGILLA